MNAVDAVQPQSQCVCPRSKGANASPCILHSSSQTASPLHQGLSLTRCGTDILHRALVVTGAFKQGSGISANDCSSLTPVVVLLLQIRKL